MSNLQYEQLEGLSEEEKKLALSILKEMQAHGKSDEYDRLRTEDYEEIPVSIEQFLHDTNYLGAGLINEEGKYTVYPYWEETLKKIFPDPLEPTAYHTLALTGAIGLGKSFMAVLCCLYELYRMICLKDPYIHYGLQPIDKITFAIMNTTLDAARGVGWDKLQSLLQSSKWFKEHGTITGTVTQVWNPPKGIELIAGSQSRHILGRAVFFCLDENTEILTNLGDYKLKDLVDKDIQVYSVSDNGDILLSENCTVKPTIQSCEEYQIELEDGSVIKCTPNHRFMLIDGTYKEAKDLTETDEILDFMPIGYVYRTTNTLTGQTYIGQHKRSEFDKNYYGSGIVIQRSLRKYGKKNHKVEILAWGKSLEELNDLETYYIEQERLLNEECLNISNGAKGGHENYSHAPKGTNVGGNNKGYVAITDGFQTRYVPSLNDLETGWKAGNCYTAKPHNMSNYYSEGYDRSKNSLSKSGTRNSMYGNGYRVSNGNNGHADRWYKIDSIVFDCRKNLIEYLQNKNVPVCASVIRRIEDNTITDRLKRKYSYLFNNLNWGYKNK